MRKNIKNKKGEISFLGEHTLGIIVGVLCILVLIVIGWKVYDLFSNKTDLEKAETNFKLIKGEIELVMTSDTIDSGDIIIYPVKDWVLRSYSADFPQAECYGKKSCLCICEDGSCYGVSKYCEGFDFEVNIPQSYSDDGYVYSTVYANAIGFTKSAEGLRISFQRDKIIIEQIQDGN